MCFGLQVQVKSSVPESNPHLPSRLFPKRQFLLIVGVAVQKDIENYMENAAQVIEKYSKKLKEHQVSVKLFCGLCKCCN